MEVLARGVRTYYGNELHPIFSVNDPNPLRFYVVNEIGAMGYLRTPHDRMNVAVVGGSATFNNGFEFSWPVLITRALPHAHLDNLSETGPMLVNQLGILQQLEARGLSYDLLFIEPPYMPIDARIKTALFHNPWMRSPVIIAAWKFLPFKIRRWAHLGGWKLFFPYMLAAQAKDILGMDAHMERIGLAPSHPPVLENERLARFKDKQSGVPYVDAPDFFPAAEAKEYVQLMGSILAQAKRVARRVVVVAPIIHYHGAPDGSDQENFFKLIPVSQEDRYLPLDKLDQAKGFVSLKSLAAAFWEKNRYLKQVAEQNGVAFYDGNAEFAGRPDHRRHFFDQFHLYGDAQEIIANRLLHLLGYDLKVEVEERVHLGAR